MLALVGALLLGGAVTGSTPAKAEPIATAEEGAATILKTLAPGQEDTVRSGEEVHFQLRAMCSSLTQDCGTMTITDVLDPRLVFIAATVRGATIAEGDPGAVVPVIGDTDDPSAVGSNPYAFSEPVNDPEPAASKAVSRGLPENPSRGGGESEIVWTTTYDPTTRMVTYFGENVEAGDSVTLYLTARVRPGTPNGEIDNTAVITTPISPEDESTSTFRVYVADGVPQWTLRKVVNSVNVDTVAPGEPVNYGVSLAGPGVGNVSIASATVVDTYPEGARVLNSGGGVVDEDAHTITWTLGRIDPVANGSNAWQTTVTLVLDSPPFSIGDTLANDVTADLVYADTSTDQLETSKEVTLVDPDPRVGVIKTGASEIIAGQEITYRIAATLPGNVGVDDVTLTDTLPDGVDWSHLDFSMAYWVMPGQLTPMPPFAVEYSVDDGTTWTLLCSDAAGAARPSVADQCPDQPDPDVTWANSGTGADPQQFRISLPDVAVGGTQVRISYLGTLPVAAAGIGGAQVDLVGTVSSGAGIGDTIENCAVVDGAGTIVGNSEVCVATTVIADRAAISTTKWSFNQVGVSVGEKFQMGVMIANDGPAVGGTEFAISDLLPPGVEYLSTDCVGSDGTGGGLYGAWQNLEGYAMAGCTAGLRDSILSDAPGWESNPRVTPDYDGTGRTLVVWRVSLPTPLASRDAYQIVFTVRVAEATPAGTFVNTSQVLDPTRPTVCTSVASDGQPTVAAPVTPVIDEFGISDLPGEQTACQASTTTPQRDIEVLTTAQMSVQKWVAGLPGLSNVAQQTGLPDALCPDWDGYTRYPCVAQTLPNNSFTYRWKLVNAGNAPMSDFVIYDILPFQGDTGVSEALSGDARESVWTPVMTGPLQPLVRDDDGNLTPLDPIAHPEWVDRLPAGAIPEARYSPSDNPCRPELSAGAEDANWQGADCDTAAVWYTSAQIAADAGLRWEDMRSIRVEIYGTGGAGNAWQPGDEIDAQLPMRAPTGAPVSTLDPLDLSVAWNSVAYRVFQVLDDGELNRLQPAEPLKVGIILPFDDTPIPEIQLEKYSGTWDPDDPRQPVPPEDFDFDPDSAGKRLDPLTSETITLRIANVGTEALRDVEVTDTPAPGSAALQGLSCDFSPLGGPRTGTSWAGPLEPGEAFVCTGTLPGMAAGSQHSDTATVHALSIDGVFALDDSDDWNAYAADAGTTPPPGPGPEGPNVGSGGTRADGTGPIWWSLVLGLVVAVVAGGLSLWAGHRWPLHHRDSVDHATDAGPDWA